MVIGIFKRRIRFVLNSKLVNVKNKQVVDFRTFSNKNCSYKNFERSLKTIVEFLYFTYSIFF